jgi:hypothetical protein
MKDKDALKKIKARRSIKSPPQRRSIKNAG